jgi:hypothetical protein
MLGILADYGATEEFLEIIAQHAYRQGAETVSRGKLIQNLAGTMSIIDVTRVPRTARESEWDEQREPNYQPRYKLDVSTWSDWANSNSATLLINSGDGRQFHSNVRRGRQTSFSSPSTCAVGAGRPAAAIIAAWIEPMGADYRHHHLALGKSPLQHVGKFLAGANSRHPSVWLFGGSFLGRWERQQALSFSDLSGKHGCFDWKAWTGAQAPIGRLTRRLIALRPTLAAQIGSARPSWLGPWLTIWLPAGSLASLLNL